MWLTVYEAEALLRTSVTWEPCLFVKLQMERATTKGRGWYNMPMAEMTEEKKNDLMVIQMRKVLDPKRFYKGPDIRGALPKYVQVWV